MCSFSSMLSSTQRFGEHIFPVLRYKYLEATVTQVR
jgi:hypothetical protein